MPGKKKTDLALKPADVRVGKRIRARRLELGITQIALGNHLNISFQQVQKYESGINQVSSSRLLEIAVFFKVELEYFFRVYQIANEATMRDINKKKTTKDVGGRRRAGGGGGGGAAGAGGGRGRGAGARNGRD